MSSWNRPGYVHMAIDPDGSIYMAFREYSTVKTTVKKLEWNTLTVLGYDVTPEIGSFQNLWLDNQWNVYVFQFVWLWQYGYALKFTPSFLSYFLWFEINSRKNLMPNVWTPTDGIGTLGLVANQSYDFILNAQNTLGRLTQAGDYVTLPFHHKIQVQPGLSNGQKINQHLKIKFFVNP
jgi:hypothetical protein